MSRIDDLKVRNPYPGGWRPSTHATEAEIAAAGSILELLGDEYERLQLPIIKIGGEDYGKLSYIHRVSVSLLGQRMAGVSRDGFDAFIKMRHIRRARVGHAVYYNVTQFTKAWQWKHTPSRPTGNINRLG